MSLRAPYWLQVRRGRRFHLFFDGAGISACRRYAEHDVDWNNRKSVGYCKECERAADL